MKSAVFLLALLLSGCATYQYQPKEYEIKSGRINELSVSGPTIVTNSENSDEIIVIYDDIMKWQASYKEISQAQAGQLDNEITKNGKITGNKTKKLNIKISRFYVDHSTFVFKAYSDFTITGDNGFEKKFQVTDITNSSVGGNIERTFNSAIAVSVLHILKDESILEYLAN